MRDFCMIQHEVVVLSGIVPTVVGTEQVEESGDEYLE